MAKRLAGILLAATLLAGPAQAQQAAAPTQPTPEQMKQMQAMMQARMQYQMQMMALMFDVRPARQGYDATLQAVKAGAAKRGWPVGEEQDMQARLQQAGVKDAKRMKVVATCPAQANERLARASGGKAPPLPCRTTVYEGKDGKTYLMRMNTANMAKLMQDPAVAKTMAEIGAEEEALYRDLVQ
ncbi:MAG: DUF302 domain-containing protein [Pseudomonadota bacterium]